MQKTRVFVYNGKTELSEIKEVSDVPATGFDRVVIVKAGRTSKVKTTNPAKVRQIVHRELR